MSYEPIESVAELFLNPTGKILPALILGAGSSYPLPTAYELKEELVSSLLRVSTAGQTGGTMQALGGALRNRLDDPHLTLEVLFSFFRYRLGADLFNPAAVLSSALSSEHMTPTSLSDVSTLFQTQSYTDS